ncbi:MAG: zf-HC2 domain-containing protein [Bacteroidota bacterium]
MPTEHVNHSLPDFILGKIGQEQRQEIERHLAVCPKCHEEYEGMKQTLSLLRDSALPQPPFAFFSGILPRLRERFDQPRRSLFWAAPFGERIVLPLAAAAVVVLMIVLTPVATGPDAPSNSLRAVLEQVSTSELVDVFTEDGAPAYGNSRMNQEFIESVVGEHFEKGGFVTGAALTEVGYGELPASLYQGIMSNLSDEDVDNLLKRLGERKIL